MPVSNQSKTDKTLTEISDVFIYKTSQAPKLSQRAEGLLTYQFGFVESLQQLFVRIEANESGGYFSKEWVPVEEIHALLSSDAAKEPFSAAILKGTFISKSQNNAGFLAAALKAESLLKIVSDKTNLLTFDEETYQEWLSDNLVLAKAALKKGDAETSDKSTAKKPSGKSPAKSRAKKAVAAKPEPATSEEAAPDKPEDETAPVD